MVRILTSKKYNVNSSKGTFRLFVSCHNNHICYAGVLWYRKSGSFAKGEDVVLTCELENFINSTEQQVYDEALDWIKVHLDSEAEIEQIDYSYM